MDFFDLADKDQTGTVTFDEYLKAASESDNNEQEDHEKASEL